MKLDRPYSDDVLQAMHYGRATAHDLITFRRLLTVERSGRVRDGSAERWAMRAVINARKAAHYGNRALEVA